jgi:hypothetical protein
MELNMDSELLKISDDVKKKYLLGRNGSGVKISCHNLDS